MLHKNYDRQYAVTQIDQEVERINQNFDDVWTRQDQLLVDAAEVQILVGDDKAAMVLLNKCFAGKVLIDRWENAAEETKY